MRARLLAVAVSTLVALLVLAPGAFAGGWALTTLDAVATPPSAGEPAAVGYTIRQHGMTPVDLADTGIAVTDRDGATTFFPGRRSGPVGHYLAEVTFPAAGRWTWSVRMDWFGEQPLGGVDVADASGDGSAGAGDSGAWLLLAGALACGALLAGHTLGRRVARPALA